MGLHHFNSHRLAWPGLPATVVLVFVVLTSTLVSACSKQSWYQGAQSSGTARCMNEPLSEYEDCNQQSDESYQEYERTRQQILEESDSR